MLCIVTLRSTIAEVFQASNPARALSWQPGHAGAAATISQRLVAADRHDDAQRLAVAAIGRDPTRAAAYAALGQVADRGGRDAQANRFMSLAVSMSRREQAGQIWFIQRYLRAGDFDAAVRHFDVAMRTSYRGWGTLVPLLVTASIDNRSIAPLSAALARNPVWKVDFLRQLVGAGRSSENATRLGWAHLDPARPDERAILVTLIRRLANESRFDLAWLTYRRVRPGTPDQRAAVVRDGTFAAIGDLAPFDWQLTDDPDLTATRESRDDRVNDAALALMAGGGRTGEVARLLLRLPSGRHALQFELGAVPASEADRPVIRLSCSTGNEMLVFRPSSGWTGANRVTLPFTVPAACRWQWLSIVASSAATPARYPWIDNIVIGPS